MLLATSRPPPCGPAVKCSLGVKCRQSKATLNARGFFFCLRGEAAIVSDEDRSSEIAASPLTIHRRKKDGGCTFYHNALRT